MSLAGKSILITGAGRRVGKALALAVARAGGCVILHYGSSSQEARATQTEIHSLGGQAYLLQADLSDPAQAAGLIARAGEHGRLSGLVNSAAIFEPLGWAETGLEAWNRHLAINLTAPFLLSQAFGQSFGWSPEADAPGRIVNILDWRALRPGADHLPYTISKAALAALTRSLAVALAPQICVNGLALGAILPPSDGGAADRVLQNVPARRWAQLEEVEQTLLFLLTGPEYVTGEVIHIDGGRHLV